MSVRVPSTGRRRRDASAGDDLVLPVVAGAYLGRWLDSLLAGYSIRWTLSMIFLGVIIGAINVYLFIRE